MVVQFAIYFIIATTVCSLCFGLNVTLSEYTLDRNISDLTISQIPDDLKNIEVTNYVGNNTFERIVAFENVIAKETNYKSLMNSFRILIVSDGSSVLQLIYSNTNKLLKCDYVHEKYLASNFILESFREIEYAKTGNIISMERIVKMNNQNLSTLTEDNEAYYDKSDLRLLKMFKIKNSTYVHFMHIGDVPNDIKHWLKYDNLKLECHRNIQQTKELGKNQTRLNSENLKRKIRSVSDMLIAPNTKWCGRGHNAENYNELGGASQADKCCRKHDHCKNNIQGMSTKWKLFNFRMYTISHCNCDIRFRRNLSSFLRIPGTKWCGKGWDAKKYSDLGGYSKVDQCCRQHDKSCLFWIMGFETKYNFYNWRVNTLMHCKCDERFRTCLKIADTTDADLVGKLFFNVVQTKCFVIKWEKICTKRSEKGKCEKTILRKRAHLRENRKF